MNEIKFENYQLHSIGLIENGGVTMRHQVSIIRNEEMDYIYANEEMTMEPVKEFKDIFEEFKLTVAKVHRYDSFNTIVHSKEFAATDEQKEKTKKHLDFILSKIKIRRINLKNWESDDNKLVSINAEILDDNKHKLNLSTKEILLSSNKIGTEANLEDACNRLIKASFEYRYEGVRADPEIPGFNPPKPRTDLLVDGKKRVKSKGTKEIKAKTEKITQ